MATESAMHLPALPTYDLSRVTFSVENEMTKSRGFAYLYIATDRVKQEVWGHLVITIMAAEPFAIVETSSLSLLFPSDLLTIGDLERIRLEADAEALWSLSLTASNELTLKLKPGRQIAVTPSNPVKVGLRDVLASGGEAHRRMLTFDWSGFMDVKDNTSQFFIQRAFVPSSVEKVRIGCSWITRVEYGGLHDTVYITPYEIFDDKPGILNRLILRLVNTAAQPLKGAGAQFTVSFWTEKLGDAKTAICTTEQLKQVVCSPFKQFDPAWKVDYTMDGETRYWILTPPAGDIFPPSNIVSFEFTNLVTQMLADNSPVLVQWSGIQGRSPGYDLPPLFKTEPEPYVVSLEASVDGKPLKHKDKVFFGDTVRLAWKFFAADSGTFTDSTTRYPREGVRDFTANAERNIYTLTPHISIEKSEKSGKPRRVEIGLLPTTASIEVPDRAGLLPCTVDLTWKSRGGETYLSGPNLPRTLVASNGTMPVEAKQNEAIDRSFLIECEGLTTITDTCYIRIPCPVIKPTMEWRDGNKKGKFAWTTEHASRCTITVVRRAHSNVDIDGLTGSYDFNVSDVLWFLGHIVGNGEIGIMYEFLPGKDLPAFSFREEHDPKGPDHIVTWDLSGFFKSAVGTYFTGPTEWKTDKPKGTHSLDRRGKPREYVMLGLMDWEKEGGVILIAKLPTQSQRLPTSDVETFPPRTSALDPASLDMAKFAAVFAEQASLPDSLSSLFQLLSPAGKSSS